MTLPNPLPILPDRKVPGWLYAVIFLITVGGYVALVVTGHSGDTSSLLLVTVPILSSIFVADRVSATAKKEGSDTRHAISNGTLTTGLLNALDHPDVIQKIGDIVKSVAPDVKEIATAVVSEVKS
jgi:hypothetical protein